MKEATAELNVTIIVVLAIGALAAFFFTVIWPMMDNNFQTSSNCADAICEPCEDKDNCPDGVTCYLPNDEDNTFTCPYKG